MLLAEIEQVDDISAVISEKGRYRIVCRRVLPPILNVFHKSILKCGIFIVFGFTGREQTFNKVFNT